MKKALKIIVAGTLGLAVGGCGQFAEQHKPRTVGVTTLPEIHNGLEITIAPHRDYAVKGGIISFNIAARNVASRGFWVPRKPQVMFMWVYSNGRRDNFVLDVRAEKHFLPSELVYLEPGQQVVYRQEIETYFFPKLGVTEFQAVYHCARNTNTQITPCWSGEVASNAYGVEIIHPRDKARAELEMGSRQTAAATLTTANES